MQSCLSPLFLLLGRDRRGDRILQSCFQKGPATALANYAGSDWWSGSSGSGGPSGYPVFSVFQFNLTGKDGFGSGFGLGSWKTVLAVPVPLSVSGKTVSTVPVSGSVPEPP